MGTRGLLGLIIAGKRHASYNHWDSYPCALGQAIVSFILSLKPEEWDRMATLLKDITVSFMSPHPQQQEHNLLFSFIKYSIHSADQILVVG